MFYHRILFVISFDQVEIEEVFLIVISIFLIDISVENGSVRLDGK